jgi:hypothetical protein
MTFCNSTITFILKKPVFSMVFHLPFAVLPLFFFLQTLSAQNHTTSQDLKPLLFGPTGIYEGHSSTQINLKKRSSWIEEAIQELSSLSTDSNAETIIFQTIDLEDYQKTYIRVQQPGNIKFINGSSASIMLHSVHEDPEIGDVSLLVSGDKIFVNYGHICGGIVRFCSMDLNAPQGIQDFTSRFLSEEGVAWEKYQLSTDK